MNELKLYAVSSLEKVFLQKEPEKLKYDLEGFQNEVISFQLAYTMNGPATRMYVSLDVESPLKECIHIRQVEHVPVRYTAPVDSDEYYLSKEPGLYPDLLREMSEHSLRVRNGQWDSLWVEVEAKNAALPGKYEVSFRLTGEDGSCAEAAVNVNILNAELPPQKLIHTKWLHCDCIAEYYHQQVFSEEHWAAIEKFVQKAVDGGINTILAPIHTPPLDTRVGGERLTTQLVDVFVEQGTYRFEMDKLRRWICMCKRCGVQYFEMAHLYTQWGAKCAPKIVATVDGKYGKLFGWDTSATSQEYRSFLQAYIPAVRSILAEEGIEERTYWHISDEPTAEHLNDYRAAKEQVLPLLEGCRIMDALSSFEFYQQGVVEHPVVASNHITPFLEAGVPDLWAYYCCGQYKDVSNMYIAMPSARNRILGVQLFKYKIEGFLQWGFNFYNAQYSDHPINPYLCTDGDGFVPAGDTFQVYPGADGAPEESIRMAVTRDALQDLRAFEMLAELESHAYVVSLMEEKLGQSITFDQYPHSAEYLQQLRSKVNAEVMKRVGGKR